MRWQAWLSGEARIRYMKLSYPPTFIFHVHIHVFCFQACNRRTWQMRLDVLLLMWLFFQNLRPQLQVQPLSQQLRWITSRMQAFSFLLISRLLSPLVVVMASRCAIQRLSSLARINVFVFFGELELVLNWSHPCSYRDRLCDGFPDCTDVSDENNCPGEDHCDNEYLFKWVTISLWSKMTLSVLNRCPDGECLDSRRRCDGYDDCRDGGDEMDCWDVECQYWQLKCQVLTWMNLNTSIHSSSRTLEFACTVLMNVTAGTIVLMVVTNATAPAKTGFKPWKFPQITQLQFSARCRKVSSQQ